MEPCKILETLSSILSKLKRKNNNNAMSVKVNKHLCLPDFSTEVPMSQETFESQANWDSWLLNNVTLLLRNLKHINLTPFIRYFI